MRIGAVIIARDMEATIAATVHSLGWVTGIFLLDDHSIDQTPVVAEAASVVDIVVESSPFDHNAFPRSEKTVRNYAIDRAFATLDTEYLISLDADELICEAISRDIAAMNAAGQVTLSFSTWHLFDRKQYLHFWERKQSDVWMIDPHTRIFRRGTYFEDIFPDGKHPAIKAQPTRFVHGPHHFHLKYHQASSYPNKCLEFLPPELTRQAVSPYLRPLPFALPKVIDVALDRLGW